MAVTSGVANKYRQAPLRQLGAQQEGRLQLTLVPKRRRRHQHVSSTMTS